MKRKLAWLTLPILLFVPMWTLEWRADNPPVTKTDLELRAVLAKPSLSHFSYVTSGVNGSTKFLSFKLKNAQPLLDSLFLDRQASLFSSGSSGDEVYFQWDFSEPYPQGMSCIVAHIYVRDQRGTIEICRAAGGQQQYSLHPATVKHWTQILLADKTVGPALRSHLRVPI